MAGDNEKIPRSFRGAQGKRPPRSLGGGRRKGTLR